MAETPTPTPRRLQLEDSPTVAETIRIVRGMLYEDRWHRRVRRALRALLFGTEERAKELQAAIANPAPPRRKHIDATGKVAE